MRVVIDRKMWNRGGIHLATALYNDMAPTHNRCCLGFFARAAGITDDILVGYGDPEEAYRNNITPLGHYENIELANTFEKAGLLDFEDGEEKNSPFTDLAISINDCELYANETERETELIELFEANGHELHFIN